MRTSYLSLLIGLTTSVSLAATLPVQAMSFNYDTAQFIKTRPLGSSDILGFFGNPNDPTHPAGYSAFFNAATYSAALTDLMNGNPNQPDGRIIQRSKNSPPDPIPYYTTGWERTNPLLNTVGSSTPATASAYLQDRNGTDFTNSLGFNNFFNYLTNNGISLSNIGLSYGQKSGHDVKETWNLGPNIIGQNTFSDPNLTLEERIYKANPDNVEIGLYLGSTQFIHFGYSDFYSLLEYGQTISTSDDSEAILSDPMLAYKTSGLNPLLNGLADAFLSDLGNRQVQASFEDFSAPADPAPDIVFPDGFSGDPYALVKFRFPMTLRAVTVPEPTMVFSILTFGFLGLVSRQKKLTKK